MAVRWVMRCDCDTCNAGCLARIGYAAGCRHDSTIFPTRSPSLHRCLLRSGSPVRCWPTPSPSRRRNRYCCSYRYFRCFRCFRYFRFFRYFRCFRCFTYFRYFRYFRYFHRRLAQALLATALSAKLTASSNARGRAVVRLSLYWGTLAGLLTGGAIAFAATPICRFFTSDVTVM